MSAPGYADFLINKLKTERPEEYNENKIVMDRLISALGTRLTSVELELWFENSTILICEDTTLMIAFTTKLQYDNVKSRFVPLLYEMTNKVLNNPVDIYLMSDEGRVYDTKGKQEMTYDEYLMIRSGKTPQKGKNGAFISEYTFDNFVVGSSNRFAHAGAFAVAENPSFTQNNGSEKQAYNPLFIYGGSGLGKTHLLYAIMNRVAEKYPEAKILYIKGDEFTNELILAIQNSEQLKFRNKYRYVDVLLVDDIQFIGGRISTQEEFFHTFNSLHEANKQIILTSDRPPKEMLTLEERLVTRFVWGLTADIQPPDYETRVAIINRKAESLGVELDRDVTSFIANNVSTNIRQIEGAVKKLKAYKILTGADISIDTIGDVLKDIISEIKGAPVTINSIIKAVSEFYSVSEEDIRGSSRKGNIVSARQVAMYITRELTEMSLPQIGVAFEKNHTTVLHSINKVEEDIRMNMRQKRIVEDLIKNIKER